MRLLSLQRGRESRHEQRSEDGVRLRWRERMPAIGPPVQHQNKDPGDVLRKEILRNLRCRRLTPALEMSFHIVGYLFRHSSLQVVVNDSTSAHAHHDGARAPVLIYVLEDRQAESDDAAVQDPRVERVIICTPDKDLAQCVRGSRIVQLNRRSGVTLDEEGVFKKFGVLPESIPTTWRWLGTRLTGTPDYRVGDRSRQPPCCPSSAIWRLTLRTGAIGT